MNIQNINHKSSQFSQKIERLLESRGVEARVLGEEFENQNVLIIKIKVPEGEYSSKIVEQLSDLKEKLEVEKVEISRGNIISLRITLKIFRLPKVIPRCPFSNGLRLPLGLNPETGSEVWLELKHNPHLLIAGSTGKGKSVCLENLILHIDEFFEDSRLILVDPKRIELSAFQKSSKLFCPIITEPDDALLKVSEICDVMDDRYRRMHDKNTKDFSRLGEPRLFLIIDEYADLMMVTRKNEGPDLETSICRIAQLGRAAGIHLIIATQRPSVDVITGLIKNNIPTRIAFGVSSGHDSRTILDEGGAEGLRTPGLGILRSEQGMLRFKGTFVSESIRDTYLKKYKRLPLFKSRRIRGLSEKCDQLVTRDRLFYGITEDHIRDWLSDKDVYRNEDARKELGITHIQSLELGKILDEKEVVKAKGRQRLIQDLSKFEL